MCILSPKKSSTIVFIYNELYTIVIDTPANTLFGTGRCLPVKANKMGLICPPKNINGL